MNAERGADYGPASAGLKRIRSSSPSTFGSTELGQSKKCRIGGDDFVLQAAMGDFKRVCENELQASVRKGYKKALAVQLLIDKISGGRQTGSSSDGVEQLMAVACLERPDAERVLLVRNELVEIRHTEGLDTAGAIERLTARLHGLHTRPTTPRLHPGTYTQCGDSSADQLHKKRQRMEPSESSVAPFSVPHCAPQVARNSKRSKRFSLPGSGVDQHGVTGA
eukprot:TRINITY_DN1635_c0_g2_i3.p1 TRINITY_DN1635_c0_g2~~TRINITY_DN1635_c0_g2_i3.p1  ORF type:complete len:222 (-),score=22.14 TRINITY_DN1635_c0_g2_i3:30-695(-)